LQNHRLNIVNIDNATEMDIFENPHMSADCIARH